MLNEIRHDVNRTKNPVTREEAQQTLDRLKSHDYLWEDQDKVTEDTKDETMYRIKSINDVIPFIYSSYDTASVYLRSERYNREPREKCVTTPLYPGSLYHVSLLIRRLQMNILTHVTMKDRMIYDKVSEILNVPMSIVRGREQDRKDFQEKLKQEGERIQSRKAAVDSVDHVTWLWRYGGYNRPDIVRSCIGLHQHNDIYIIDNQAYRKPSEYHAYSPEIRYLLYCVLLVDDYSFDDNDQANKVLMTKLREKYFTDIHLRDEINLRDIREKVVDKQGNTFKFKSEDIRHDVMYAFVTECLVKDSDLEFFLTTASRDLISEYCRSWWYERSEGERCLYVPDKPDKMYDLFIDKLQLDIITHCTVSDWRIHERISKRLNIPLKISQRNENEWREFQNNLKYEGEIVHFRGRSLNNEEHGRSNIVRSCIGLHQHWDIYIIDNKAYRKPSKYHKYSSDSRCLLYCLLFLDKYALNINEQSHKNLCKTVRGRYFKDLALCNEIKVPAELKGVVNKQKSCYKFKSVEIRQDVMYAFVTECLVEESDLEFFLKMASKHVVSEYCRSWNYERSANEKCLYIPDKPKEMYDLFIDNLQVDILVHCFMSEKEHHSNIRKRLNIPEEIFSWDLSARKRFVEISQEGRVEMFRARGMIVGCAGAGKTTLLENLKRVKRNNEFEKTETTVGLEVHEDLFEIIDDKLMDFSTNEDGLPIRGIQYESSHGKKLISMTDFAGQVAYYACHQVYLSKRAFYLIVIDMSKELKEKVCKHNVDRHNPKGSLFHAWKYKDYFHFWLQSIKTYCDEGNTQPTDLGIASQGVFHPVILVASHKDKQKRRRKRGSFFDQLNKSLSKSQTLKELISPRRYFEVECPEKTLTNDQKEKIEDVRNCIVETVKQLPQWGEKIPLKWAKLEEFLRLRKNEGVKCIKRLELKANDKIDLSNDDDLNDALRFFHEIGQLIYFSEKEMKNVIIINVQWFVDGFKYIITDETHFAKIDWYSTLDKAGKITGKEIEEVWRKVDSEKFYINHKQDILPYLDKLGLMTKIQGKDKDANDELFYIPSMNRIDLAKEYEETINRGRKTSIILFHFKTYLPHFFFFRLVVKCLNKWKALDMEMFCKNAAFYKVDDASHYIVIAVNKTSIQLQVFTPEKEMALQTESVIEIKETVKSMIHEITQTFHRQTKYEIGYTCKDIKITEEDEECFLTEDEVIALKTETGRRPCPKHVRRKQRHTIDKNKILRFWRKEDTASFPKDNYQTINESELEADP
ncbi:uncharacterized protein LOC134258649 [Saccostrea cucullata]|uniref:uncharacterized protein LOC134258649 n=1 Tax=Saccostrea cuccullata TaxID=36930 RepID=UPI002ED2EFFE